MNNTGTKRPSTETARTGKTVKGSRAWRIARFWLLGLAALVTLFALYHVEENWRGKRAWNLYKARMEAQGAVFEFEKMAPPPVPDDQNFAMTPLLKPVLEQYPPDTFDAEGNLLIWKDPKGKARAEAIDVEDHDLEGASGRDESRLGEARDNAVTLPRDPNWRMGERFDLAAWQRYYAASTNFPSPAQPGAAATDVLLALSRFDAELEELKRASQRPYSRFNIRYGQQDPISIRLPHVVVLLNMSKVIQLKAVAELETGNVETAFEDVKLILALSDSIKDEPFLISHLVRIALLRTAVQTVWEGLVDHRWTTPQLEHFHEQFLSINLVKEFKRCLEAERALGASMIDMVVHEPALMLDFDTSTGSKGLSGLAMRLIPRGWWYLEGLNYSRAYGDYILAELPDDPEKLDARLIQSRYAELQETLEDHNILRSVLKHRVFMQVMFPALGRAAERSVEGQALVRLAVVAIALERYYLANGRYPAGLSALAPDFIHDLPNDPVTHESFRYELTANGAYRLWSVGWNLQDDGGEVLYRMQQGERVYLRDQLDWVWPSVEDMRLKKMAD